MIKKTWRLWMVAAAYGCFMTVGAMAQDHDHDHDHGHGHGQAEGEMSPEAMMQAYADAAKPGEHHKHLNYFEGEWNAKVTDFHGPEPTVSKGTAEYEWILDGHYMQLTYKGEMMGQPFDGRGIMAYDKVQKKYVDIWMDSMSTGYMISYGTCDASGKKFNFEGEYADPMSGGMKKLRSVLKVINDNSFVFEMHGPGPDGKDMKMMEITYTRS